MPPKEAHTDIQHVKLPKIRETINVTETEVLGALRMLWPDCIPPGAEAFGLDCDFVSADPDNPDDIPVLRVSWLRDPAPGEYERMQAEEEAAEAQQRFLDKDEEYDDLDDGRHCLGCGRRVGGIHELRCGRSSHKNQEVTTRDCVKKAPKKKKWKGK
jgi:hypothetical protein